MYTYKARVLRVVDGDTMDMGVDLGFNLTYRIRVRVENFDAPETWRPKTDAERLHGEKATLFARSLLDNAEVTITTYKDSDIYGRYSASIQLPDGRDYVTIMKENGFDKLSIYV